MGAQRLLSVILDEVKTHSSVGSGSVVYDIAVALICAPDVNNLQPARPPTLLADHSQDVVPLQTRLSLRDALRMQAEEFKRMQKSDPVMAEHVLRLYRRVEAQLAVPQVEMLQDDLALGLDGNAAASLSNALAAAQNEAVVTDDANMSLGLGGTAVDLNLSAGDGAGLNIGADDDLFGVGRFGNNDIPEGWGGMDLS
jgi:mediator of RNA polymerase II transcription subunit 5